MHADDDDDDDDDDMAGWPGHGTVEVSKKNSVQFQFIYVFSFISTRHNMLRM